MKLILASTIMIGATAKPSSHHKNKSEKSVSRPIAGLRGQQKADSDKQRELQGLFGGDFEFEDFDFGSIGDFFSGGDTDLPSCGETCTNPDVCTSFTSAINPTSVFKDACNAGCFPKMKLSTCEQYCVDDDAASTAAAITAVERLGMFDSMVDIMCSDCKFYQCCVGNDEAPNPTKYDACMQFLDDDIEEQAMGNSVLDQIANAFDSIADIFEDINIPAGDGSDGDLDSVLDQIADSVTEALDSVTEVLDAVDLPDLDWNFTDNVWGDSTDATGADQMASALSVLSELVDSIACPKTCANEDLCSTAFMGTADNSFLENACNAGCLPAVSSCDEICGNVDGLELMESVAAMACKSCNFFKCCGEDQDSETKFVTCQKFMPEMGEYLALGNLSGNTANTPAEVSLSEPSGSEPSGSSASTPEESTLSESNESPAGTPAENALSESSDSSTSTPEESTLSESNESPAGTPAENALSESSDSSTSTLVQDPLSEPIDSPIVPVQSASFEVSRVNVPDSGSSNTEISMLALASIATLFFASF